MKTSILFVILLIISAYSYAQFVDINAGLAGVENSATAWGDIDNDGDLDLVVTGQTESAMFTANIYKNDGVTTFTNINAGLPGVLNGSVAWGDYNRDGYIDLVISGQSGYGSSITSIYRNNGDNTFTDINAGLPGTMYSSSAWGDYDNDGDLDLLFSGSTTLYVYRNNGNATFTNLNATLTGITYSSVAWGDYDNDGDLDILSTGVNVATYYTKLYKNNGNSTFTEVTTNMVGLGYGSISWGDYDNDGDLDALLTGNDSNNNRTKVYRNDGNNVFTDIGAGLASVGWGSAVWGDYDSDGLQDVLLEGHTGSSYITRIYHNNGGNSFTDIGAALINVTNGSTSWADFDNDGKLDFILTGGSTSGTRIAKIYKNNFTGTNTAPAAPTNLHTYVEGSFVVFAWTAATDTQTPSAGLNYQLRLGTTPGGSDIISPMATPTGLNQLAQFGYANGQCTWKVQSSLLSSQFQYYWSVQAIDGSFASSAFAPEAIYRKLQLLTPNGGETWIGNTTYTVHWIANPSITTVNVFASIDGTWIQQNTYAINASLGYYPFRIFNTASSTAQVKIENAANPSEFDVTDAYFNISVSPTPTIELYQFTNSKVQVGKTYNFSWFTMYVDNVNIDYSINGGGDWTTIASSVPTTTTSLAWTVPNTPAATCYLRITDAANPATYVWGSTPFTISKLAVTSPNGGEFYQTGTVHAVTWDASQLTNVKLEYSTNAGSSWATIVNSVSSTLGTYNWTMPATASTQYMVRISSTSDATINDISNAVFTGASLTLTAPTASGIRVQAGKTYMITWSQEFMTGFIKLDYSTNGGSTYTPITWGQTADLGYYNWTVPATTSANCKIRISSMDFPTFTSTSANVFYICSLALTSPNGSEEWGSQIVHNVTWNYTHISNLKVEYTADNGSTWNQIIEAIPAVIGHVTWTVPNTSSTTYKVRVTDTANSSISDISDNLFTVRPQIILSSPNGGENWQYNSEHPVLWSATSDVDNVMIDYSVNNGTDWLPIQASYPASGGTYGWTIPDHVSTQCLVKVSNAAMTSAYDTSDANFTIPVTPPTAAFTANFTEGYEPMDVQFTDLSTAGSGTLTNWSWNFGDGNTSTVPSPLHHYATDGYYTVTLTVTNSYDSTSTISKTDYIHVLPSEVLVTFPNGGEILPISTVCSISWTATPDISHVDIEYSVNNGMDWLPIQQLFPTSIGTYDWTIPDNASTQCLVRVSNAANVGTYDTSDSTFIIPVIPPTAEYSADLIEGYQSLTVHFTDLSSTGSGTLTHWLWNFGDGNTSIEQNPVHQFAVGTYTVTLTVTNSYDSTSTLVRTDYIHVIPSVLTLTSPNGGETIHSGTIYQISWTATPDIMNVKLDYSINGGDNWLPIIESTPASSGAFQWMIPNNPSTNCLIMVSNTYDFAQADWSNLPFTIPVISPTADFTSSGTEGYQIFGVQFNDRSVAGSGTITNWSWNFGDEITSDEQNPLHYYAHPGFYTVSLTVTNSYNATTTVTRTDYIHVLPSVLTLLTPNGGEILNVDSSYAITWTATPNINNIHIEYMLDGLTAWQEIAYDYPASAGVFNWTVPGTPYTNCLIRMWDANDILTVDWSEAPFTINVIHPTANFTSTTAEGYVPFAVQFTESSLPGSGTITSWSWNFGDGSTSTEQNPAHLYNSTGYYTVSLTVTNSYDSTDTVVKTDYVHVMPSVVSILSPTAGEILPVGSVYSIQWTATPDINSVNIFYSTIAGASWTPIINNCQANLGAYQWTVPNEPSSICKIAITDANNSGTFDIMDGFFTIPALSPTADFTANLTQGYVPMEIQFTDSSVPGSGTITNWLWNFGDGETSTEQNPVHTYSGIGFFNVTLTVTNSYDSTNVITKMDYIHGLRTEVEVLAPYAGAILPVNSYYGIQWNATENISNVNIYYRTIDSSDWIPIIMDYPAFYGAYGWTVPNNPSPTCQIYVTNASDSTVNDVMDGYFIIPALAPVAGWTSDIREGYSPLEVHFVDLSAPGSGTLNGWSWNFGDGNLSTEQNPVHTYLNEGYYTVSLTVTNSFDSTATLTHTNYIHVFNTQVTLLTPNGGNILEAYTPYNITWTNTPDIVNVKIEYSVNHGTNWITLAEAFTAYPSSFEWLVPDNPSAMCLVRISDAADSTTFDVSDTTFTIPVILPTAEFTADITEGQQTLTVHFTEQSTPGSGIITSWLWNFGDGQISVEQNPTHEYTTEGYYTVSLEVINSFDSTATISKTNYIHVLPHYPLLTVQLVEPLDFGMIYYGATSPTKVLTLQNTGTALLTIASGTFLLSNSPFQFEAVTFPIVIAPGSSIDLRVRFTPNAIGSFADSLIILNDSPNMPRVALHLSGSSTYAPPKSPENLTIEKDEHNINLYWDPVTEDMLNQPIEPDYYIVFFNDGSSPEGTFYYCGMTTDLYYIDLGVMWYAKTMLYHVRAFHTDGRRDISKLPVFTRRTTEEEVIRQLTIKN